MKIAILGMGKIGSGVYEYAMDMDTIAVVRTFDIKKWMDDMTTDIDDIVNDPEIELVVETMGGVNPTKEYALKCINAGKHYVTANKQLVSEAIEELLDAAKKNNVCLMFGAACGGGIPYLKNLYNAQNADKITAVGGILNGTTNYILDRMQTEGLDYEQALTSAQALGYAEKDPASDVDGLDAQRKLILACAVAWGLAPKAEDIPVSGIRHIKPIDIKYFKETGRVARLIASADKTEAGVSASVEVHLFREDAS
ncbi:MAG: homoserine dehydrogenase [Clostridia bacterium]|nr:homoserine dehydrogenase [Clostridia bacterium]